MTALYMIGGILLFAILLLIIPLSFCFKYDGEPELILRYMFIKIKLVPPKEKAEETKGSNQRKTEKESDKESKEKKSSFKTLYKKRGLDGLLDIAKEAVSIIKTASQRILRHIVIKNLKVDLVIVGEDAADTAMKYGYVCAGIYPAISFIDSNITLKRKAVDITAGFNEKETRIFVETKVKIRPIFLLGPIIAAAFKSMKLILKIRNDIEPQTDDVKKRKE